MIGKENIDKLSARIDYVDYVKGFAMLLVIMGHVGFGDGFSKFIHGFHVPIFFFVSGYLHKNNVKPFATVLKKKFSTLIVPYLFFGLIGVVIYAIMNISTLEKSFLGGVLYPLFYANGQDSLAQGVQWFLTAFFFTNLYVFFIEKIQNMYIKGITVFIFLFMGTLWKIFALPMLPLSMEASFVGVFIFYCGKFYKLYIEE